MPSRRKKKWKRPDIHLSDIRKVITLNIGDHVVWRTVYLYADQCYYVSDSNPCNLLPGDQRSFVTQSDLYRLDPAIRTGDSKQHVRGISLIMQGIIPK